MTDTRRTRKTGGPFPEGEGLRRPGAYRWVMLALVWLSYAAFGLISRSIAPLVTPILADLGISYGQMGLVLGSWQLSYIGVSTVAGSVTDRFGVRAAVFAGLVIMSLSAVLRHFASGFIPLLMTVMLFGAGAPLISIGAPTAISHWFSGKGRGIAVGVYTTAPSVGGLIALSATHSLVMPLAGFSWRLTFVYFGLVSFVVAAIWLMGARDAGHAACAARAGSAGVFSRLIGMPAVRIIFLGGLLAFCTSHGLTNWLPKLLESRGMGAAEAGFLASIPLVTSIFSVLCIPSLTPSRLRGTVIAAMAAANVLAIPLLTLTGGAPMVAGLVVFGIAGFAVFPLLMLMLMDTPEVKANIIGMAVGVFFTVAEVGGFSGPLLIGTLCDLTGSFLSGVVFLVLLNLVVAALAFELQRSQPRTAAAEGMRQGEPAGGAAGKPRGQTGKDRSHA
jgi:cyanate permease